MLCPFLHVETTPALCETFEDVSGKKWEELEFSYLRGTGRDGVKKCLRPEALVAAKFIWHGGAVAGIGVGSGQSSVIYLQSKSRFFIMVVLTSRPLKVEKEITYRPIILGYVSKICLNRGEVHH